jgi:putative transposase
MAASARKRGGWPLRQPPARRPIPDGYVENAFIESFNGKLRDELLNAELFMGLLDARRKIEAWRRDYNENRPHSSIGDLTPIEFANRIRTEAQTVSEVS